MTDIESKLTAFVSGELLMRPENDPIGKDEDLLMSGLLDSIAVMRLVGHIEDDLQRSVPPEDVTLENFSSIETICGYLNTQTAVEA